MPDLTDDDVVRFSQELTRAIRWFCPSWLQDQCEDLVQASLIKLMKVIRDGKGEVSRSYLWQVAHSVVMDEIRKRTKSLEVSLGDEERDSTMPVSDQPGPDRHYEGKEIHSAVRDCLQRLVSPRRAAVILYILGHRGPQISQLMSWDSKKTKNLTYRGLTDVRECLLRKGFLTEVPS